MSKRTSMTWTDDQYAAIVKAVGKLIVETGATTNVTEYIKTATIASVCRDLGVNQLSDL